MKMNTLQEELTQLGYRNLFLLDNDATERIWNDGENQNELLEIIRKTEKKLHAKFLAAEVLNKYKVLFNEEDFDNLAEAYTFALVNSGEEKNNVTRLNGNLWGFLYEMDDAGPLGQKIIEFGDASLSYLIPILDNGDKIIYEGSKSSKIGDGYAYRIKDFAAFYISKIKDQPITFYQDLEKRDQEIERFKKAISDE